MNKKWLFSVINDDIHKVITIFGVKFKFKNNKLIQREQIKQLEQKINSANKQTNLLEKKINTQQEQIQTLQEQITAQAKTLEQQSALIEQLPKEIKLQQKHSQDNWEQFCSWQQNFYKENPSKFPIRLSEDEKQAITNLMNKSTNYLEFGSGGSTFLALNSNISKIYSVESDKNWLDYISSYKIVSNAIENDKLKFQHINIGKTGDWGYPINDDMKENYPKYSSDIFNQIHNIDDIDLVFIDGRFRVACTLATILNCNKTTKIMIHDYTIRDFYHLVEEFLDIVEIVDTLAIFKIKENLDKNRVQALYEEYKYTKE